MVFIEDGLIFYEDVLVLSEDGLIRSEVVFGRSEDVLILSEDAFGWSEDVLALSEGVFTFVEDVFCFCEDVFGGNWGIWGKKHQNGVKMPVLFGYFPVYGVFEAFGILKCLVYYFVFAAFQFWFDVFDDDFSVFL